MSIKEQSINTKKVIIASNESSSKKEELPIKTSQSMNTESYEYFSQKITTKNNLTESSIQTSNQNAQNQLLQCTCSQNSPLQNNELKCTCNQNIVYAQCTCGQGMQGLNTELKCTCGQLNQKCTCGQMEQQYINSNQSEQKCTCGQAKCTCGLSSGISIQKNIEIKNTTTSSSNYNNASSRMQKISVESSQNKSAINTTKIHEENKETSINAKSKICNCGNRSGNMTSIQNIKKAKVTKKKINLNKNNWNKRCVGQNNENLQIIAAEKPELLMQCVQDLKVIQEPRPVQILLPIVPNEIDYPLGLEIYGKEKKVFICPENVENLNVSKAYSKIEPHFENLDIGQTENVHCEKTEKEKIEVKKLKKERYDNNLTMENGEMNVKGHKDFNKDNSVELTTKMNVKGKQKINWNETNEAIKTTKMNIDKTESIPTFDNLNIEKNVYNYQGQTKTKFSSDETNLESNEEMQYPAEYVQQNWNLLTIPMSGKPFTLEGERKVNDEYRTTKGGKITIKKSYETTDWNKKNNKRREVQINMVKRTKKNPLIKQKVQPVSIKGKENNWNDIITEQNDTTLKIDKTEKVKEDFVLTHGEEVSISKEGEDILINDDYNIVEENYTRPIRANIQKVPDASEESVSSEYDVLKGISKYMGQYQYKEIVGESLKIKAQNIIINDISGKYPRRIESYHGLDENFEKISRDQYEQTKLVGKNNYNININYNKKIIQHNQKEKEQSDDSDQNEQNEQEGSNENENENEYEQESDERDNNGPEDAQEPGQEPDMEPEEQENMDAPQDKDHIEGDEGQHEEIVNEHNVLRKEQYYYLKKNEEKNDSEPKDEIDHEQESNQNEEDEAKDTPIKNEQSPKEKSPKIYIKEITYTKNEQTLEKKEPNLKYITLKRREEDEQEEEKKDLSHEEESKENKENENKVNQYLTMPSKPVDEEHISRDYNVSRPINEDEISQNSGENEKNKLDAELKKKEEINAEINKEEKGKEENIEHHEEEHIEEKNVEEKIEHHEEGQLDEANENEEEHVEHNEEEHEEKHVELNEEEHEEENNEEHMEEHDEEHVEENDEEHVEEHEEEHIEPNDEEEQIEEHNEVEENNEHHEEGELEEENENEEEQVEHAEQNEQEHINNVEAQKIEMKIEQHGEQEHVEENKEKQIEQKVEEKMEQKEEKSEGQFEEDNSKENDEAHSEEKIEIKSKEQIEKHEEKNIEGEAKEKAEQHIEEHAQENSDKHEEESHKEQMITENRNIVIIQKEKQNIEQEKETESKENIQEKKEINIDNTKKGKVISISNIVAEAIKSEMKSQEELKGSQEIKMTSSENISLKKSKLDPSDNYTKITSSKISLQPLGERMVTKTVIHQKIETSSSNNTNPMVYSFGKGSLETSKKSGQHINLGSNITFGQNGSISSSNFVSGSGLKLEKNLNSNQIQFESNYNSKSNMTSSDLGINRRYYFSKGYSSYTYSGRSMREPMDTIKGRKRMENTMKAGYEIDELNFGPRDSKRK